MDEVSYYTLAHGGRNFIHQHLVDAYGAQHVRESKSTIRAAFALAGLYLAVEKGFSGRQVQLMHMKMARRSRRWPRFAAPLSAGAITVADILAAAPGQRDHVLLDWCASVWAATEADHARVREMVDPFL